MKTKTQTHKTAKPFCVIEWDRVFPSRWAIDGEVIGFLVFDEKEQADEICAYMNIAFCLGKAAALKDVCNDAVAKAEK